MSDTGIVVVGYKTAFYDEENLPIPEFTFPSNYKEATITEKTREKTDKFKQDAIGYPFLSYISELYAVDFPSGKTITIECTSGDDDFHDGGSAGYDLYNWLFNELGYEWPENYDGYNQPFVLYGFEPKKMLKLAVHEALRVSVGEECFNPELWLGNSNVYRDIKNCLLSTDYTGLTLKSAFDWYGIPGPPEGWVPGQNVKQDVVCAIEIATKLHLLTPEVAALSVKQGS